MSTSTCPECGHPSVKHYAKRMVDWPAERNGVCGVHTGCEDCER